jgi:hypothetical protein
MKRIPTETIQQGMQEAFQYDLQSGRVRWRQQNWRSKAPAGSIAGCSHSNGYIVVSFKGAPYMAHHIAWLLHYGVWPSDQLLHVNGNKSDNRIGNLAKRPSPVRSKV